MAKLASNCILPERGGYWGERGCRFGGRELTAGGFRAQRLAAGSVNLACFPQG